jgi:hypothetical protein
MISSIEKLSGEGKKGEKSGGDEQKKKRKEKTKKKIGKNLKKGVSVSG